MFEQTSDELRAALVAFHATTQSALQLVLGARRRVITQLSLDRVVEVLIRVQFRAVGRQKEQLNLCVVLFGPFANGLGSMYLQVVQDEKSLFVRVGANVRVVFELKDMNSLNNAAQPTLRKRVEVDR